MKSVMISIHPKWVHKILDGKKTVEVRKTVPKIATPFKCYIYMTSGGWEWRDPFSTAVIPPSGTKAMYCGAQKVVGEFICDKVECFGVPYPAFSRQMRKDILEQSCLTYSELHQYAKHDHLYAWHISDLKVYDKPKKLSGFFQCHKCEWHEVCREHEYSCDGTYKLKRPPQSWCYVEEL